VKCRSPPANSRNQRPAPALFGRTGRRTPLTRGCRNADPTSPCCHSLSCGIRRHRRGGGREPGVGAAGTTKQRPQAHDTRGAVNHAAHRLAHEIGGLRATLLNPSYISSGTTRLPMRTARIQRICLLLLAGPARCFRRNLQSFGLHLRAPDFAVRHTFTGRRPEVGAQRGGHRQRSRPIRAWTRHRPYARSCTGTRHERSWRHAR
jgi:hypothetical protein